MSQSVANSDILPHNMSQSVATTSDILPHNMSQSVVTNSDILPHNMSQSVQFQNGRNIIII